MISREELTVLSFYRASELAGSLLFGKLALNTDADAIRVPLTEHCFEEAAHAWLWTRTIQELGHTPLKVTRTYQSEFGKEFGMPRNTLEILCLTQVFERRVLAHFRAHRTLPGTHQIVQRTLDKMIHDEEGHIDWVRAALDAYARTKEPGVVEKLLRDMHALEHRVYERFAAEYPFAVFFKELVQ